MSRTGKCAAHLALATALIAMSAVDANARPVSRAPAEWIPQKCQCLSDVNSKKYLVETHGWTGIYKEWTCNYTCVRKDGTNDLVTGTRKLKVWREAGDEFVCEGTVYHTRYNPYTNEYGFFLEDNVPFNPAEAKSPELREWAQRECR